MMMIEYYELTDARGNSNSYIVSNASSTISTDVQDYLMHACLTEKVREILHGSISTKNFIVSALPYIESMKLQIVFNDFLQSSTKATLKLEWLISDINAETERNSAPELKSKGWKKDLSYVRSLQIMTGYNLNFFEAVENLAIKLGDTSIANAITRLHKCTSILHENISKTGLQLINNKFIK